MPAYGMEYQTMPDQQLAVLARRDRQAFAEIYDRYVDRVYSYALYRTGNEADTQDIVSGVFLRALEHIGRFESRGAGLRAWLLRIAHNLIMDNFRRQRKAPPLMDEDSLPDVAASPEEVAELHDSSVKLRHLVQRLPDAQKEVIILKFNQGLSNQEIARVTGRSETAVSSLQYRALQNLRNEVGKDENKRRP